MSPPEAKVIHWGGYYAVVSYNADGARTVYANRFRSFDAARRSADRRNAQAEQQFRVRAYLRGLRGQDIDEGIE